jgi:hypothetical protein
MRRLVPPQVITSSAYGRRVADYYLVETARGSAWIFYRLAQCEPSAPT